MWCAWKLNIVTYHTCPYVHANALKLGILKAFKCMQDVIGFTTSVVEDHKKQQVDGDNPLTLTEAFLHKVISFLYRKQQRNWQLKLNYVKKQLSSSIFLLTRSRYIGPKWPCALVPCLKWMELGCKVLLGHF